MNKKNIGNGRALAYSLDSRVLRRVIPGFGLLDARKLNDDDAPGLPVTLYRLRLPATHQEFPAVSLKSRCRLSGVLLIFVGICDFDIGHDIACHDTLLLHVDTEKMPAYLPT